MIFKIWPKIWSGYMLVGDAGLILYFDTKFPDPFYADFFVVLLTAMDGKQKVSFLGLKKRQVKESSP